MFVGKRNFKLAVLMGALLSACGGGGNLSFKNADTLIETYSSIIKDMTEVDRQTFDRNVMLIINDDQTPSEELGLNDWNQATSQGTELKYLAGDNPGKQDFASSLALRGVNSLDGKSPSYVNERGSEIKQALLGNEAEATRSEITDLKTALQTLKDDAKTHQQNYQEAWAAESKLMADAPYKLKPNLTTIAKGSSGMSNFSGTISFKNETDRTVDRIAVVYHITFEGYTALVWPQRRSFYNRINPGATAEEKMRFQMKPVNFKNSQGEALAQGTVLPNDITKYDVKARVLALRLRNGRSVKDAEELQYPLEEAKKKTLFNYAKRLSTCDNGIENIENIIPAYETRLAAFENDKLDNLVRITGRYLESCK